MSVSGSLEADIRRAASRVDPAKQSTTKWRPIEALVAEALGVAETVVYATTISKPGNLSVRGVQSRRAQQADVIVVLYTGRRDQLHHCVDAAVTHTPLGVLALVFADDGNGMTLETIVTAAGGGVPPALASAYPAAMVVTR